jgi:hypothetical protein
MHTAVAPTLPASFSVIAERFRRAGQMERAIALCREGLQTHPEHLSARVTLGCALLDMGEFSEAHRELQAVLKRAPDNLAAIRGLAELHARGIDEQDAQDMQDAHDAQLLHDAELLQEARTTEAIDATEDAPFDEDLPASEAPAVAPAWSLAEVTPQVTAVEAAPEASLAPVFATVSAVEAEPSRTSDALCLKMIESESLDELDPAVEAAPPDPFDAQDPIAMAAPMDDLDPAIEAATLDDLDPIVAAGPLEELDPMVEAATMQFEIEDVIAEAEESLDFIDTLDFDPPMEPHAAAASPAEPIPVPALSEGPVAVLDEWLIRVRARRSALLSEYAAS